MPEKINAIAITGPTASGKTALSISLAKRLGGEIISLDSMQIYKGMDIGTAKATHAEQAAVPHHMLDILPPDAPYSAYQYKEAALEIAEKITLRGLIPIFVGGTGLYLDTLRRTSTVSIPPADTAYRLRLLSQIKSEEDKIALHRRLYELDSESAEKIHYNNVPRVIRALEICERMGMPKSEADRLSALPEPRIDILHITLDFHSRDTLYSRIDNRVDLMYSMGLAEEVERLMESGAFSEENSTARFAIGYKEILDARAAGENAEAAREKIKQASRNYAKRQLTWFRHDSTAHRIFADDESGKIRQGGQILAEAFNIIEKTKKLHIKEDKT